ncbi:MAG TPA: nicotinamide riboside transporter PnuC, partial [Flavisolibacter sp.]|nr:nicotinamide riboside transporter PnuC [Flavisolibacter sp.]
MQEIVRQFISELRQTSFLEFIAVFTGIASVWFSKKENILVYPVGLVNTTIYVYLSIKGDLFGEASVNLYYTVMSIYGWIIWTRKNDKQQYVLTVTKSSSKEWRMHLLFFAVFYITIYAALIYLRQEFNAKTIPWADALASATAYTGMWLMAKKKVESWFWWIATNTVSIRLYYIKGFAFTSVPYVLLLVLAIFGWLEWYRRA